LQNVDGALKNARSDILENIASADDMPAKIMKAETFAEGFGEGTEDAKYIGRYVDRIRSWMEPLYDYHTKIVQYRAWNAEFYATIQNDFPDYRSKTHAQAFFEWQNSFVATWPNLLTESDSDKAKADDVKLKALMAALQVLMPEVDPENRAIVIKGPPTISTR